MLFSFKTLTAIAAFIFLSTACRKNPVALPVQPVNKLVSIDGIVFDTTKSSVLSTHMYALDTLKQAYTLTGYGAFAGKIRTVKFSTGGSFRNVPVMKATGFNDYGYSYFAQDTSGSIWEIYQQRFNTTGYFWSVPITVFTPRVLQPGTQWNAWAGMEQGVNSLYNLFAAKVISSNAATSAGVTGCIEIEYSAPDYKDTVFIKPGRGPLEFRSWRAHLHENNQPAYGGYK